MAERRLSASLARISSRSPSEENWAVKFQLVACETNHQLPPFILASVEAGPLPDDSPEKLTWNPSDKTLDDKTRSEGADVAEAKDAVSVFVARLPSDNSRGVIGKVTVPACWPVTVMLIGMNDSVAGPTTAG